MTSTVGSNITFGQHLKFFLTNLSGCEKVHPHLGLEDLFVEDYVVLVHAVLSWLSQHCSENAPVKVLHGLVNNWLVFEREDSRTA